jgi:hypothetical protein
MGKAKQKFVVYAVVRVSVYTEVEAASEQEAVEIAEARGMPGLCHQCSGSGGKATREWRLSDGVDGEPTEFHVEGDA